MTDKKRILGVDYADDVEQAFGRGELGDAPLDTSADGIAHYEHSGNDERTWKTLRTAHESL